MGAKKTKTKTKTKKTTTTARAKPKAKAQPVAAPPAIDKSDVKAALERIVRAPASDVLDVALSAWRSFPFAELAEAINVVPLEKTFLEVTSSSAVDAYSRIERLRETPTDPRVSDLLVSWVANPPYHATSSQPFHRTVFSEIARHADPRAIKGLAAAAQKAAKRIKGRTMKRWVVAQATRTSELLRDSFFHDGVPPKLPAGLAGACAQAKRALSLAVKSGATKTTTATAGATSKSKSAADRLLEAIRQDPTDDGAREVYADYLIEKGDPRGEFITMQLRRGRRAPTEEEAKRELSILRKHVRRWLGELAQVVGGLYHLEVGPAPDINQLRAEDSDGGAIRFERGFLTSCSICGSKTKIAKVVGHPDLATLEGLHLLEESAQAQDFLIHPVLGGLMQLSTMRKMVPIAVQTSFAKNLAFLEVLGEDGEDFLGAIQSIADARDKMPNLRHLDVNIFWDSRGEPDFAQNLAAIEVGLKRIPSLERLSCYLIDDVQAEFTRSSSASTWALAITNGEKEPLAQRLRALVR